MFRKILCPTDFSQGSEQALRTAVRLANEHDAELVLVHAWYLPPLAFAGGESTFPADTIQEMVRSDEQALAKAAREAATLGAKRVTTRFLTGVPWDRLVETMTEDAAFDLVVMGTQGRTGFARVLLGSVTEKVIRHAPCSVLAVRPSTETTTFQRVLCPVDLSESSRQAMLRAGELVARGGAITLLHVIDLSSSYAGTPWFADYSDEVAKLGTQALEHWAEELRGGGKVTVTTRLEIGSPVARSLAMLDEPPRYDLAVVGSHGRTGIRRVLLGSVAEKIVRHASCPVLVARAPRG